MAKSYSNSVLLLIDNYDSFTFNLAQYFQELGETVRVVRNDVIDAAAVKVLAPSRLVISPGPGTPANAGVTLTAIRQFAGQVPILGVCLGMQAIGEVFGGQVTYAPSLVHGKTSSISHDGRGTFSGLDNPFAATRYHSLCVDASTLPKCLEISAWTGEGAQRVIMGLRHRELAVEGVQFHPESILTLCGKQLLANWLSQR